jgi:predicted nucleic acid-binding protein
MMSQWRLYLDNCCFNRPFDDQTNLAVYLETQAKLYVQEQIKQQHIELVWSFMLTAENEANPDNDVRDKIADWRDYSGLYIDYDLEINETAHELQKNHGVDAKDALHVACALKAGCHYFLTTDKKLIRRTRPIDAMKVINPLYFIDIYLEDISDEK